MVILLDVYGSTSNNGTGQYAAADERSARLSKIGCGFAGYTGAFEETAAFALPPIARSRRPSLTGRERLISGCSQSFPWVAPCLVIRGADML